MGNLRSVQVILFVTAAQERKEGLPALNPDSLVTAAVDRQSRGGNLPEPGAQVADQAVNLVNAIEGAALVIAQGRLGWERPVVVGLDMPEPPGAPGEAVTEPQIGGEQDHPCYLHPSGQGQYQQGPGAQPHPENRGLFLLQFPVALFDSFQPVLVAFGRQVLR